MTLPLDRYTGRLADGHGWRAQPGHKILVLGRGALRIEYPRDRFLDITHDCVKLHDKKPPDDDCALGVSYHRWPATAAELTVAALVRGAMQGDEREFTTIDPVVEETRIDLSLAWSQGRFIDAGARRDACARLCIARKDGVQALISFDFWLSDLAGCGLLWKAFLTSLQLGEWVADPRAGPRLS